AVAPEAADGLCIACDGEGRHFAAEGFLERSAPGIPGVVGIEERAPPGFCGPRRETVVGEVDAARESDEDRLGPRSLEEGALDDGPVGRDDLELPGAAVGKSLGQPFALADEAPDGGDLALRVAAEHV